MSEECRFEDMSFEEMVETIELLEGRNLDQADKLKTLEGENDELETAIDIWMKENRNLHNKTKTLEAQLAFTIDIIEEEKQILSDDLHEEFEQIEKEASDDT